ncbi:MAG TPA: hypothetical protein VOA87_13630 [Thermoanaerobaculia bacterium]|nr:hypothetical protein [Thermoanaerobaculia bacterium]
MKVSRPLASLVSLFLLASCGGGGGHGGSGPTAPPQGNTIIAAVTLADLSGAGLLNATVSLDGKKIGEMDWSTLPSGCGAGCIVQAAAQDVSSGTHTLTVTAVKLAGGHGTYAVFGLVVVTPPSGTPRQIDLPQQQVTLQAGSTVQYPITI